MHHIAHAIYYTHILYMYTSTCVCLRRRHMYRFNGVTEKGASSIDDSVDSSNTDKSEDLIQINFILFPHMIWI
ncbi:hypothetical protein CI610_02535 [invertebrate metagenome]|uniref:Uncharacterized protein n=1 Tax=invertebrate metagenome TaxID=1711999 RepID=A0A2H9T5N5_9ZZZZ